MFPCQIRSSANARNFHQARLSIKDPGVRGQLIVLRDFGDGKDFSGKDFLTGARMANSLAAILSRHGSDSGIILAVE